MQKLLLIFSLFLAQMVFAQRGFLYVKKKGFKKVRSFEEGSMIKFKTKDGEVVYGGIQLVKKDSIYVNSHWFNTKRINKIYLRNRKYHFDAKTFLLTTAGVAISTAGMTLAEWASFKDALAYSAGIGYGNFIIANFPSLKRKKYSIGKKFTLQTLDLHF